MSGPRRTLLAPGNEAAWAQINESHREAQNQATERMTVAERVEHGLALSALAHEITSAVSSASARGRTT